MKEAMFWLPWRRKYSSRAVCSVCSCLWDDRRSGRGGEGRGRGKGRSALDKSINPAICRYVRVCAYVYVCVYLHTWVCVVICSFLHTCKWQSKVAQSSLQTFSEMQYLQCLSKGGEGREEKGERRGDGRRGSRGEGRGGGGRGNRGEKGGEAAI